MKWTLPSMPTGIGIAAVTSWIGPTVVEGANRISPLLGQASGAGEQSVKSWILEAGLVILLFAAALFVICRSSRRV